VDFQAWPKTPRLFRTIVVSEKIDGTNAAINISKYDPKSDQGDDECNAFTHVWDDDENMYCIGAQSRNRLIFPAGWYGNNDSDNAGFARWVDINAQRLFDLLGPGRHYGEWWGKGVGRNYGVDFKQFSLFNTDKWGKVTREAGVGFDDAMDLEGGKLGSVPVLFQGAFSEESIENALRGLRVHGSAAVEGWMQPEGIVVYHTQSKQVYKVTLDNQDRGKWETSE
jgi:RNA ligase-like protein